MPQEDFHDNAQAWGKTVQHRTREALSVAADQLATAADSFAERVNPVGERLATQLSREAEQGAQQVDHLRARMAKVAPAAERAMAQTRERVNEEVVPRLAEFVSSAAGSGAVALKNAGDSLQTVADEADAAKQNATRPRRVRRLVVVALGAGIAGAVAAVLRRRNKNADPWGAATSDSSQPTAEPSYPAHSFGDVPEDSPSVEEGLEATDSGGGQPEGGGSAQESGNDEGGWVAADEQTVPDEGMTEAQEAAFEGEFTAPNLLNEGVEVADGRQG